jgi:dihydrofolate synthase/folylpolyglutamate synthase
MDFKESIDWLYSFKQYGSKLGLERIFLIMKQLKNPQNNIKIVHVTGTNGKGSVCKYVGSILQKAGYSVGVYISPHLERFSERIVIDDREISDEEITLLVEKIKPVVDEIIGNNNTPTFFEIVTAMAFLFFSDSSVDFAVVEVGLGGRFDATNVVIPVVSVITNISLEHTARLGEDVKSIAFEKAGIIKDNVPVITAVKDDAKIVVEKTAKEKNAQVICIDKNSWKRLSYTIQYQEFLIYGILNEYTVKTSMLGSYQGENIALAVTAAEQLQMNGTYLTDNDIIDGISTAFNPGRMEIIAENPTVLLDGAHNPAGMKMLKKTLKEDFEYERLILIIGILEDKDIQRMLTTIIPVSDVVIVTKSKNARACEPTALKDRIKEIGYTKGLFVEKSLPKAIDHAKIMAGKKDVICISGSLFTVGEARSYFAKSSKQIIRN